MVNSQCLPQHQPSAIQLITYILDVKVNKDTVSVPPVQPGHILPVALISAAHPLALGESSYMLRMLMCQQQAMTDVKN